MPPRRIRPADGANDGSDGRFVRGLPAEFAGPPDDRIDYDSQAGCPSDVAGGTYTGNVTGAPPPGAAPGPKPFKLGQ